MGTSLTGLTPATTYDALIKVGDNGPLSATAKYLSDGLGNDSALALSTGNIGIGTTSPSQPLVVFKANAGDDIGQIIQQGANGTAAFLNIVGNNDAGASFNRITSFTSGGTAHWQIGGGGTASTMVLLTGGSERMRITSAGNVGIGTTSPLGKLDVADSSLSTIALTATGEATDQKIWIYQYGATVGSGTFRLRASNDAASNGQNAVIIKRTGFNVDNHQFLTSGSERVRISDNGLSFNGDTAAANALDDYEEGTWTMGVSFGGGSTGVTYDANSGTYTKIGRQVTVNGYIILTSKGSDTGSARVTGLPFTVGNTVGNFGSASLWFNGVSFLNQFQGRFAQNQTYVELFEITSLGVVSNLADTDFTNTSQIMVSATYFV